MIQVSRDLGTFPLPADKFGQLNREIMWHKFTYHLGWILQ
jgi:hypothetical protein